MKIAVTSQNLRTVTPHAGRTRKFLVFEAEPGRPPVAVDPIEMPKELAMHEWHGAGAHPLDAVDVLIAGSFGAHFASRLAARGIPAIQTDEQDPQTAVETLLAQLASGHTLRELAAAAAGGCGVHGDHEHGDHEHGDHEHGHGHHGHGRHARDHD
ncbi:MAG: nitrogen fixation protein [Planctomycetes bacterium]|nr:nitrogen fixation protein [Planctomycetota bacterium]